MSFTEAVLAGSFSDVWLLTGGVGKSFQLWQGDMVTATLNADGKCMAAILAGLKEFCAAWQGFDGGADAAAACGNNFKLFFHQAGEVVETCIPGLLGKMSQSMDSQVLETQDFYKKQAGDAAFLPGMEDVAKNFWATCCSWCVNSSSAALCKDGLITMAETLDLKENEDVNQVKEKAILKCRKHMAQYWGCVCAEAIQALEADAGILQLRTCLSTLQEALAKLGAIVEEGFPGADAFKVWVKRWVLSAAFGEKLFGALDQKVSDALRSQPDIDSFLVCRNSAKLRQICFAKQTHESAVGGLEEFQLALAALDGLPVDHLSQAHLGMVKTLHQKVNKVKCYSVTVHGLNMLFNRYTSKTRKERSAMLRERLGGNYQES